MRFFVHESRLLRNEFYVIDSRDNYAVEVAGSRKVAQERADAFNSGSEEPVCVDPSHPDRCRCAVLAGRI